MNFQKAESDEECRNLDFVVKPSRRETHQRVVKFLALSGSSLALLGTEPAFAAVSQIPNGMMQTFVSSLGDLGDISSGFASVRKIFLFFFFLHRTKRTMCLLHCHSPLKKIYVLGFVFVSLQAFLLIFFSELGDKTFFIAVYVLNLFKDTFVMSSNILLIVIRFV